MRDFRKYSAYSTSFELGVTVMKVTAGFPRSERYELTSQLRRAAVSVPSNIAEGAGRPTAKAFAQFLGIALGSLHELEVQLAISERLGYLEHTNSEKLFAQTEEARRSLIGLMKTVRAE